MPTLTSLPPLRLPDHPDIYVQGEVTVHPNAAIASGVILQAGPGSRIVIGAGACIGMGVILQAYQGDLEIGEGASLGAGVLIVGQGRIGANACIGASTTIYNHSIAPRQLVPAGSLIGDPSRQGSDSIEELQVTDTVILPEPEETFTPEPVPASTESAPTSPAPIPAPPEATPNPGINVYGKVYVNQLLVKLMSGGREVSQAAEMPPPQQLTSDADPWDED
ncbi:MAG: hypothetical protein SFW36_20785 [Leptolyngbyaceae cyanobacterium bins.59]|nr:hypothetical protein [Leptolyngbyaceae cyanobacterium bins.59]